MIPPARVGQVVYMMKILAGIRPRRMPSCGLVVSKVL
jgi:hypothetical protein